CVRLRGGKRIKLVFHEALEPLAAAWVPELPQCFGFNLAYALVRDGKLLTHFFQSMIGFFANAEAYAQYLLLARRERGLNLACLFLEGDIDDRIRRRDHSVVFGEIN